MLNIKKGDKVGIISPSSCLENNDIAPSLNYLRNLGLIPVIGKHVQSQYRYMGGTAEERASDIIEFFKDAEIKALFCTRGGAGSIHILPYLDYDIIRNNPKPIFGFSDSTALQNGIYTQTNNISYSGILLLYDFKNKNINPLQEQDLHKIISNKKLEYTSGTTINSGETSGTLIGGNIYALNSLCGTPYFPDLSNKILFLEDTGIKSYQLDIMLQQIKLQKGFNQLKGLIFGQFENIRIVDECDGTIDDNIRYFCQELNIPAIKDFAYGHTPARHILPIGKQATLNANKCCLTINKS